MKINGIGNVSKSEIMGIMTEEGKNAIKSGAMTLKEAADLYKLDMVKKSSKIGNMPDAFSENFCRIPEGLFDKLTPNELGSLVDAFYQCYSSRKVS